MGYYEAGNAALQKADERILASINMEYVSETIDASGGSDVALTSAQESMTGLSAAANKEGAQGGAGFYANLSTDTAHPNWVKADTIAGNNKIMQWLKGATDITGAKAAADSKQIEAVKVGQRPYSS